MKRDEMKKFCIRWYKHERLYGRGEDYGDAVVDGRMRDIKEYGKDLISHHESATGQTIWYKEENEKPKIYKHN